MFKDRWRIDKNWFYCRLFGICLSYGWKIGYPINIFWSN